MLNKKIIILIAVILVVLVALFFGAKYFLNSKNQITIGCSVNKNILAFEKLFIEKVLEAKGEIPYEDRLNLEYSVAEINDQDITNGWQSFLASTTEVQAQQNVIALLKLFTEKIIN